ncbi:MAG: hypothetical protein C4293_03400, partial [Nitrospiraceae bacterium]
MLFYDRGIRFPLRCPYLRAALSAMSANLDCGMVANDNFLNPHKKETLLMHARFPALLDPSQIPDEFMRSAHPKLRPLFVEGSTAVPGLRKIATDILARTKQDSAGSGDIAALIEKDPGLTCRVLQVANSLVYMPSSPITTVQRAVTWLGFETIHSIAVTMQLIEQLLVQTKPESSLPTLIGRAIIAATQACDLGTAIQHP